MSEHRTSGTTEVGEIGREVYERVVVPQLRPEDRGKYVAVDVDAGEFEVDADDLTAVDRLLDRRPGVRLLLMRAGYPTTYTMRRPRGTPQ